MKGKKKQPNPTTTGTKLRFNIPGEICSTIQECKKDKHMSSAAEENNIQ